MIDRTYVRVTRTTCCLTAGDSMVMIAHVFSLGNGDEAEVTEGADSSEKRALSRILS